MGVTVQSDTDRDGEEIKSVGGWFYYYEIGDDCVGNKYGWDESQSVRELLECIANKDN